MTSRAVTTLQEAGSVPSMLLYCRPLGCNIFSFYLGAASSAYGSSQ